MLDAKKSDSKDKIKSIRADFDGKFSHTEFLKIHKKEIDDLVATAGTPAAEPVKMAEPPKMTEKPKTEAVSQDERDPHEMLKQLGWTEINGTWTWDKANGCFRVEEEAELVNPAQEGDMSVRFRLLDSGSKIRVLARVEKGRLVEHRQVRHVRWAFQLRIRCRRHSPNTPSSTWITRAKPAQPGIRPCTQT